MRSFALTTLAAATLALAASTARADVVTLDSFAYGPATTLNVGSPGYSGVAGEFSGTLNGTAFLTFCTDLLQVFHFGQTYSNYSIVSGAVGFGAKSTEMDRVMSYFMSTNYPSNAATSAAAQAVIWEVLYETGPTYNFTTGAFKASSSDAATQTALNSLDWTKIDATPISYHVDRLYSPTAQDFLVVSKVTNDPVSSRVPEPSSISLVAAALAGLVAVGRRRRSNTQR